MSIPKKYLLTQTAVGMLPIKYARTIRRNSFISLSLKLDYKYKANRQEVNRKLMHRISGHLLSWIAIQLFRIKLFLTVKFNSLAFSRISSLSVSNNPLKSNTPSFFN